jgi:MoxR-like ATPase
MAVFRLLCTGRSVLFSGFAAVLQLTTSKGKTMRDQLTSLSKGEILWIFRHLNGGQVGFNFEPVQKLDLIDRLQLAFTEEQLLAVLSQGLPEVNPKGIATSEEGRPVPPVTKPSAPAVKPDANAALAALQALLSPTVDEATVRQIVMAEVKKAMDDSPIVKIEVVRPDGSSHKVEGHTRPEFKDVLLSASCGLNILLVGPAGSGKTHLAHQVAEALGRPFASVSCTAGMSESALQGWLIPGDGGAFQYLSSDFVKMYEEGGVFLFDEIDAADSNTLLFVNQALANGSFFLPIRKNASVVKRHPDFVCIAAANTFGTGSNQTYAGRERLDEATLDRFRAGTVVLDYDQSFERKVVAPDLLAWGWAIRKRISEARLNRVMSTRFLLDATKLLKAGKSVKAIQDTYFVGWKADERSKVEV